MIIFKTIIANQILWQFNRKCHEARNVVRKIRKVAKDQIIWYPGHINKGVEQLNNRLIDADAIIEVHDCRIPLSGRTNLLNSFGQVKPKILILNKVDLISKDHIKDIENILKSTSDTNIDIKEDIIFAQLNNQGRQYKLYDRINEIISSRLKTQANIKTANHILVTGIPNVGKSTFINSLRNWHSVKVGYAKEHSSRPTPVGPHAGVTRSVSYKILISDGPPPLYVLDSPGIWEPSKENLESVLKMALCGCFNFDSIYKEAVVDYMLYFLNKNGHHDYVDFYKMPGVTDDVLEFAQRICISRGLTIRANKLKFGQSFAPDLDMAFKYAIKDFNNGDLGKVVLDRVEDLDENQVLYRNRNTIPLGTIIKTPSKTHFPFVWA